MIDLKLEMEQFNSDEAEFLKFNVFKQLLNFFATAI